MPATPPRLQPRRLEREERMDAESFARVAGWRHHLHARPELAFHETETASFVADLLASWGIAVHCGIAGTGVVGVIEGAASGQRALGLRADMDALPMEERSGVSYRSTIAGRCHACGHDGHTAILLEVARRLAGQRDFAGTVNLIFQPAEETGKGARAMLEDGLLARFPCDEIYGLHNMPLLPAGSVGVTAGPIMSGADRFTITVRGVGGHASTPERAVDPIVAAAELVGALQTIASRSVAPLETCVVSVCTFQAGDAHNIIPGTAVLGGSVRSLRTQTGDLVERRMRALCTGAALAHGCEIELDYQRLVPPTVNDAACAAHVAAAARRLLPEDKVLAAIAPVMASEDFACFLDARPGAFFFLGAGGHMCHHPEYVFDDTIIPLGVEMFLELVSARLGGPAGGG
jgi:hippurate hydrolase